MTTTARAPAPPIARPLGQLEWIPITDLYDSPLNPRERYDKTALAETAASLQSVGQLTPLTVRRNPNGKGGLYEIGAGHRRLRAAKLAGLEHLAVVVRDLDDVAFAELVNIENLQRQDLHALEEAKGFRTLMERAGYDVAKIAERIGRSTRYVYDSLTLLKLIPEANKLFLAGAFERGHAIELARLTPTDQGRALDSGDGSYGVKGLFQRESIDADDELDLDDVGPRKPVTVREFKAWVDERVRFRPHEADPVLFPETVQAVKAAAARKEKVIEITYDHVAPEEVRDPEAPKIHGAQAWKSATPGWVDPGYGGKDGRPCDHARTAVIIVGRGRGQTLQVCIAKEQCPVHWSQWQKDREKRRKERAKIERATGTGSTPAAKPAKPPKPVDPWEDDDEVEARVRQLVKAAAPALAEEVGTYGVPALPDALTLLLAEQLSYQLDDREFPRFVKGKLVERAAPDEYLVVDLLLESLPSRLPGKPVLMGYRPRHTLTASRSIIALAHWLLVAAPSYAAFEKQAIAELKAEAKAEPAPAPATSGSHAAGRSGVKKRATRTKAR